MTESSAVYSIPLTSALSPSFSSSQIKQKHLKLKSVAAKGKLAFLLYNVFSREECEALIKLSEDCGYSQALVNIGGGREMLIKGFRDSSRVLIDDREFVHSLLLRISPYLPDEFKNEKLIGINERLRFLRYDSGDKFKAHFDGSYRRPDNSAETLITLQIYLNRDFVGGETSFLDPDDRTKCVAVKPEPGMILVFEHRILHEGSLVKEGRKYTIRSDVLYTTKHVRTIINEIRNDDDEDDDERNPWCGCQCPWSYI